MSQFYSSIEKAVQDNLKEVTESDFNVIDSENEVEVDTDSDIDLPEKKKLAKYTGKSLASALTHFEGLSIACANKIIQHISREIISALSCGYKVYIRGIGSLFLVYYPARWGRHRKSGNFVWIEESIRVKFKASSFITKIINANIQAIKEHSNITINRTRENTPLPEDDLVDESLTDSSEEFLDDLLDEEEEETKNTVN